MDGHAPPCTAPCCYWPHGRPDTFYTQPAHPPFHSGHQPYVSAQPLQVNNTIHTGPYLLRPSCVYSSDHDWGYPGLAAGPEAACFPATRRLATVLLPTRRFHISHRLLTHLLPRVATAPHTGPFSPLAYLGPSITARFPPALFPDPGPSVLAALTLLFGGLERMSRGEGAPSLFGGLESRFGNARDQVAVAAETFRVAFALCVVLDMGAGLGCSDELASHVGRFLLDLMPRLDVLGRGGGNTAVCAVVLGFAKVFRATAECVEVLGYLWDGLDGGEREFVARTLREGLVSGGVNSNAHRMWRALREMGMAGHSGL
ncbi:hypothetical protein VUR80DRAFT_5017 [Thermomyces stellatus]